jgi:uncharacterized lipoprotein NlpE involved in copper resistance
MINPRTATRTLLITLIALTLSACNTHETPETDAEQEAALGIRRVDITLCLSTTSNGTQSGTTATCETTTATFDVN